MMNAAPDLRRQVLDASLELIGREGLSALSMREVARRAGVSHQAPYHHFGDREGIFVAIADEGFRGLRQDMEKALASTPDPIARLQAIGAAYVTYALRHPSHFKVMFRSELAPLTRHAEANARADTCFDLLVSVANGASAHRTGRIDAALPLAAWSLAHGLATLMLESKLDRQFGVTRKGRESAIAAVLGAFTQLLKER
jgi:AcrR family transcriptional regulator